MVDRFEPTERREGWQTQPAPEPATVRSVFHAHGLRCTRQRETLYRLLASTDRHPTAEELFNFAASAGEDSGGLAASGGLPGCGLSLATVYNTLEAFTDAGLVRRLPSDGGNGPARYDADTRPHAHFTTPDGRVVDASPELTERLLEQLGDAVVTELEREAGGPIVRLSIELGQPPSPSSPAR